MLLPEPVKSSQLKTEQGHSPAQRPSSQDLSSCFPFTSPLYLCFCLLLASSLSSRHTWLSACISVWSLLADLNLLASHHNVSMEVHSGVMHGLGCFHTNCCCYHVFLSKSRETDCLCPADCGRLEFGPDVLKMLLWLSV